MSDGDNNSAMAPSPTMQVPVGDPRNVQDLTAFVSNMLQQMQERFHQMSEEIVSRIDDMGTRIDDLEKNIADVMVTLPQFISLYFYNLFLDSSRS